MTDQEDRLSRIEEKVDKLSEAIIAIARAEEKLIQLRTLTDVLFKKVEDMNSRMTDMERSVTETKAFTSGFNKIAWLVVSGLLTALTALLVYKFWG